MTAEEFPKTLEVLHSGLTEAVAPGFVAGVWEEKNPMQIKLAALGNRRIYPSLQPMLTQTIFDIASLTKVFATTSLVTVLVERKWIKWDTPLQALLPDYPVRDLTLSHLLTHTAGLPAWKPLWEVLKKKFSPYPLDKINPEVRKQEMRNLLMKISPEDSIGKQRVYSDITFLLLGYALEEATQMTFQHAVQHLVWNPMGIKTAFFSLVNCGVEKGRRENVAATEDCHWRGGVLQGQVHDDNAWAMGGMGGHAGVFTNASELLKLSAQWLGHFFTNQTQLEAWNQGWDTPSLHDSSSGKYFSSNSIGHLGFTGTSLWIDPVARLAVVLLSNRVHPSRENIKIRKFRPRFHDALREDLRMQ
jgi:serine-type D-Ala-D-Ala carboxypeptidase